MHLDSGAQEEVLELFRKAGIKGLVHGVSVVYYRSFRSTIKYAFKQMIPPGLKEDKSSSDLRMWHYRIKKKKQTNYKKSHMS